MLVAMLAVAAQSALPQPTRAEAPQGASLENTRGSLQPRLILALRYSDDLTLGAEATPAIQRVAIPAPPVPRECTPRYMAGPAVGMVLGYGAIGGGAAMIFANSFGFALSETEEKTRRDRGVQAGGAILMTAGVGALAYSIAKLVINRRERRRVCEEHP